MGVTKELDDLMPLLPVKARKGFAIAQTLIDHKRTELELIKMAPSMGGIRGEWFLDQMLSLTKRSLYLIATIRSATETL